METLKAFWDEMGKYIAYLVGFIVLFAILLNIIGSYYQAQLTGYSFAQCFWAGDTIKQINLVKKSK